MDTPRLRYVSFLVRLWGETGTGKGLPPRAAPVIQVKDIPAQETHYFSSLEQLCAYLRERAALPPPDEDDGRPPAAPG